MIWGLEGRHDWDSGAAVLNRLKDDAGVRVLPRFKLTRVGGLGSVGDSEDVRELAVGREGEIPRRSFRRGKTVTYEGVVQAASLAELREYESDLRAAYDDQRTEKVMTVTPHPLYDGSGASRFFRARALACDVGDEQLPIRKTFQRLYERSGVISVRLSDRRYYDGDEQTDSSLAIVNANNTDTAAIVNGGKVATDPVITVTSSRAANWAPVRTAMIGKPSAPYWNSITHSAANTLDINALEGAGQLVNDGVTLAIGDRVLFFETTIPLNTVPNDQTAARLGIYVYDSALGGQAGGTTRHRFIRATDADATAEFAQHKTVSVQSGALYGGKTFEQTTAGAITVDTTALAFAILTSVQGVAISNNTLGVSLVFPSLQLLAGDSLVVDFRTRRVTLNGIDVPNVLGDKSWWDAGVAGLAPGSNTIELSTPGGSGSVAVNLAAEIAWYDAYV